MPSPSAPRTFLRTVSRYMTEPHPFARNPVTVQAHAVPWNVYFKRVGRTGKFVGPMAVLILGWPLAAEAVFKHRM